MHAQAHRYENGVALFIAVSSTCHNPNSNESFRGVGVGWIVTDNRGAGLRVCGDTRGRWRVQLHIIVGMSSFTWLSVYRIRG